MRGRSSLNWDLNSVGEHNKGDLRGLGFGPESGSNDETRPSAASHNVTLPRTAVAEGKLKSFSSSFAVRCGETYVACCDGENRVSGKTKVGPHVTI